MLNRSLFLLVLILLLFAVPFWPMGVRKSRLRIDDAHDRFPTVSGFNLLRNEVEIPRDLATELTLLFVPFLQQQQAVVDSWIPAVQGLMAEDDNLEYFELPTIDDRSVVARTFINEGMRAGIPDESARARTVTLYIDTTAFRAALDIPSRDDVHLFLVDQSGTIRWRTTGRYDEEKATELRAAIARA